eukprot:2093392-Prymnesium_polylepis.1
MLFDPLAIFFHFNPDAFLVEDHGERIPVRVTHGPGWMFERCGEAQADGHVTELSGVDLPRYEAFLRGASALKAGAE